jgi:hypothetical protein
VDGRILSYITLALALHGSLHLTAWNWVFPTAVEKLLWRISSFGLIVGLLPLVLVSVFFERTTLVDVDALRDPVLRRKTPGIVKRGLDILGRGMRFGGMVFMVCWVVFLVGCSVFLFLGSFLAESEWSVCDVGLVVVFAESELRGLGCDQIVVTLQRGLDIES